MTTTATPPDYVSMLMDDPWIAVKWRRGVARRNKALNSNVTVRGGGSSASEPARRGGRYAFALAPEQRMKNAFGVKQAVVKVIRGGGVKDGAGLRSQLNYLSREGELEVNDYDFLGTESPVDGRDEIKSLARSWQREWKKAADSDGRAARGKNQTFHLLVSFPKDTDAEMARDAADSFADKLLHSGEYGDVWGNVRAWHTDREHPHMHIVINRRGESGRLMRISPKDTINPALLRRLQVIAAAEHGIDLNDTPRASRGVRPLPQTTEEYRVHQKGEELRGRNERRSAYGEFHDALTVDAMKREAGRLKSLAYAVAMVPGFAMFSAAAVSASEALQNGEVIAMDQSPISREDLDAMSTTEFAETMRNAIAEAEHLAANISNAEERVRIEVATGQAKAQFATIIPEFHPEHTGAAYIEREDGIGDVIHSYHSATDRLGGVIHAPTQAIPNEATEKETPPTEAVERGFDTLSEADKLVIAAYEARGMDGEKAVARIKGGRSAAVETLEYWNDEEIRERMRIGDIPKEVAEAEIGRLHAYSTGVYVAAEMAIERDAPLTTVELPADEYEAPKTDDPNQTTMGLGDEISGQSDLQRSLAAERKKQGWTLNQPEKPDDDGPGLD